MQPDILVQFIVYNEPTRDSVLHGIFHEDARATLKDYLET